QVVFSPDGQLLAAGEARGIALFDTSSFQLRFYIRGDPTCGVAFSPDSQLVAIRTVRGTFITLWDVSRNREVARFEHANCGDIVSWKEVSVPTRELGRGINVVAFSPDGKYFAACGSSGTGGGGGVLLWRLRPGEPVPEPAARLSSHSTLSLCFSLDSRLLAWAEEHRSGLRKWSRLQIWDLERSREHPAQRVLLPPGRRALEFS